MTLTSNVLLIRTDTLGASYYIKRKENTARLCLGLERGGKGVSDSVDLPEDMSSPSSVGVACPGFISS